jgi:ubiquinone/menaquinone biosynthesis C-methylase UbiE
MDAKHYWDSHEAVEANRRDKILKELEIRAISSYVRDGMRVLDVGCGDGETAIALLQKFKRMHIVGMDSSSAMLAEARKRLNRVNHYVENPPPLREISRIDFVRGDVCDLAARVGGKPFDLIYTERSIINLPTWEAQAKAISDICGLLKPGGKYVMCEHSRDGLDQCNAWRAALNLPPIKVPWHNRYLRDEEIYGLKPIPPPNESNFAGLYYYHSRVLNAKLAADAGVEPDYDAPINRLALDLPLGRGPQGFQGYSRIWVWQGCGE